MKKILKASGLILFIIIAFLTIIMIFLSPRVNPGLPFGYYGEYNVAKNIIKRSQCVDFVKDDIVHTDVFSLENFSFNIQTKSGRKLTLGFVEEMDIRQVCEHPKGIIYYSPSKGQQVYSYEYLANLLQDKNIKIENINEFLCHIDDLAIVFQVNNENEEIPRISENDDRILDYLMVDLKP